MSYLRRGQKESRRMIWIYFWALVVASCSTPAILTPPPTGGCFQNTEHRCNDGACCLNDWSCGGDDQSCPIGACCFLGGPLGPQMKGDAGVITAQQRPKRRP